MAQKFIVYKENKGEEGAQFIGVTTRTGFKFIKRFVAFLQIQKKQYLIKMEL